MTSSAVRKSKRLSQSQSHFEWPYLFRFESAYVYDLYRSYNRTNSHTMGRMQKKSNGREKKKLMLIITQVIIVIMVMKHRARNVCVCERL